ncbi:hypothetical protein RB195_021190 [Necator americanus]
MTVDDTVLSKVIKYGKLIKKKEKVAHALSRLNNIEMTLEILSATNIGRYVNRLCHDSEYGRDASRIIEKWKEVARQSGVRGGDEDRSSEDGDACERDQSPVAAGVSDDVEEESHSRSYNSGRSRSRHDSGHEDGYRNDDTYEHVSTKHRRKRDEDSESYHDDYRKEEGDLKRRRSDGKRLQDQSRSRSERYDDDDSDDGYRYPSAKRSRNVEHTRDEEEHSSDNSDHSLNRNYDSDEYRDVTSPKSFASSSKQRQSSSHGSFSKKRDHPSEESELTQHASSSKMSSKTTPSKKVVTEFDMMLQSADSGQPKHKKQREPHWKWSDMPVLSNYQPFPQAPRASKDAALPLADDFNPENMFKPRNERGKVFAGRRKNTAMNVSSLFNICIRVLCNNIGVLLYAEYIPYDVLKPVFERCTVEELASIEAKHPYLEDDSDELWQRFVSKKYPGEEPDSDTSWKDLYYSLEKEKEDKLKRLSQRIGKIHQADSGKGQRKTMLADATAPSYVRRRQMQHGIAHASRPLPSAIEVSSARRKIFETGGSKAALAAIPSAVVNRNSTVGAKTDRNAKKAPAKKGALMIKTMKMLNMKRK